MSQEREGRTLNTIHHELEQVEEGYQCRVCHWSWKWPPTDGCPGVPRYRYGEVPPHFLSYTQLHQKGLRPPDRAKPDGCSFAVRRREWLWLYDEQAALPRPTATERQLAALAKARMVLKERHTCKRCGYSDESHGRRSYNRKYRHVISQEGSCFACQMYLHWIHNRVAIEQHMQSLFASESPFIVIDTETTSLPDQPGFQVVEVAAVDRAGQVVFSSLVRPDLPVPTEASAIHGLTDADLEDAPSFDQIWPSLVQLLNTHEVYGYNVEFDRDALMSSAERYGLSIPKGIRRSSRWHCLMLAFSCWYGEWSAYWEDWLWQSLAIACDELEVEVNGAHRAVADARAAWGVMKALAQRAGSPPPEEFRHG